MSYCHLQAGGLRNIALYFGREDKYGVDSVRVKVVQLYYRRE